MAHKLETVVAGDSDDLVFYGEEPLANSFGNRVRRFGRDLLKQTKTRTSLDQ